MVHLILDENNKPIGWEMKPTNEEEQEVAAIIRDLQFFGSEDTAISYNGLKLIDKDKGKTLGNIESISWKQEKHQRFSNT
jgi:hypothetical protein